MLTKENQKTFFPMQQKLSFSWPRLLGSFLLFLLTILFFLFFILSLLPLVGYLVGWLMLVPAVLLFFSLLFSVRFTFLQKRFLTCWLRYSLYTVLIGLVATAGCNLESKKNLKKFQQETLLEKNNLKQLWSKLF